MTTKTTHYFYRTALTLRSPFHNYTNSAVSFNMYSQQFTLCYCLVKSHFSSYSLFKFVYVTSGAPLLRKILEPPLVRVSIVGIRNLRKRHIPDFYSKKPLGKINWTFFLGNSHRFRLNSNCFLGIVKMNDTKFLRIWPSSGAFVCFVEIRHEILTFALCETCSISFCFFLISYSLDFISQCYMEGVACGLHFLHRNHKTFRIYTCSVPSQPYW